MAALVSVCECVRDIVCKWWITSSVKSFEYQYGRKIKCMSFPSDDSYIMIPVHAGGKNNTLNKYFEIVEVEYVW